MGGGYYDRDVGTVPSTQSSSGQYDYTAYTDDAKKAMSKSKMDSSLSAYRRNLVCNAKNPIVVAMDVTGSMGDWSKIIYDKMPMFYGQIMLQGYLEDPSISFSAVGDAYSDKAPIQICDFAKGKDLDSWLTRIWLEGNGGGQGFESYELTSYFYARHCTLQAPSSSFYFISGDEGFYKDLDTGQVKDHIGDSIESLSSEQVFQELKDKFNVFLLHKSCAGGYGKETEKKVLAQWKRILGERVLMLEDPKSVVDVMLGAISIVAKTRDLDSYLTDMKERGQTQQRINDVKNILTPVTQMLGGGTGTGGGAGTGVSADATRLITQTQTTPAKKRRGGKTKRVN